MREEQFWSTCAVTTGLDQTVVFLDDERRLHSNRQMSCGEYTQVSAMHSIFPPKACILQHVDSWGSQAFISFIKDILMKKVVPPFESESTAEALCLSMRGLPEDLIQNRHSSQWIIPAHCVLCLPSAFYERRHVWASLLYIQSQPRMQWVLSAANGEY